MRYGEGHKAATRQRILEVAARRFRRDGVEAVGLVPIMSEVGLTHGGFYAHFGSKDALVAESARAAFAQTETRLSNAIEQASASQRLEALLDAYLSESHRDAPETGCAAAALAGELARAAEPARQAFAEGFEALATIVDGTLDDALGASERRQRALAIVSMISGAMALARATPDPAASTQILGAARRGALDVARRS